MSAPLTHTTRWAPTHDSGLSCVSIGSHRHALWDTKLPSDGVSRSTSVTCYRSPNQKHSTMTTVIVIIIIIIISPIWSSSRKRLPRSTSVITTYQHAFVVVGEVTLNLKGKKNNFQEVEINGSKILKEILRFQFLWNVALHHRTAGWVVAGVSKQRSGIIVKGQVLFKKWNILNTTWQCRLYLIGSRWSTVTDLYELHFYTKYLAISWPSVKAAMFFNRIRLPWSQFSISSKVYLTLKSFHKLFTG